MRVVQRGQCAVTPSTLWRSSASSRPRLRVGLLLESTLLEKCYSSVIEDIRASNFASLELLVFRKCPKASANGNGHSSRNALYDLYVQLERRMTPPNDPLEKVDCASSLSGIERLTAETDAYSFPSRLVEAVRGRRLDALVRLGTFPVTGEILTAARHGVWSYQHADNEFYRGGPPHFWELYERKEVSGVELHVLNGENDGLVLCKSIFTTQATISASANRFAPYWGATHLVIRKLNELHQYGWDHLVQNSVPKPAYKGKRALYENPNNLDMARWLGPVLLKKALRYPFRAKMVPHWKIGVRVGSTPLVASEPADDLSGFRWIESPPDRYFADPFGFEHDGKHWVFFEEYSYGEKRAWISCAEISRDGQLGAPVVCLSDPQRHYSYPYIFRDGGDVCMIPEAYDSGSVDLYRCELFPNRWTHKATLLKGKFVDTSVWHDQGLWWIMTTSADPSPRTTTLLLFYAESLTGEWHFHPANPISTDVRYNRGAGWVFQAGGRWIRPSQSAVPHYGYSFTLNEITELSTERYSERPLRTVTPEAWKGLRGVHTYNSVRDIELIDGGSMVRAGSTRSVTTKA